MKTLLNLLLVFFPWAIRRYVLIKYYDYDIHPTAKIGLAYVYPKKLIMKKAARIDHFTVGIHLDEIVLESESSIGRSNWITGFPTGTHSLHFKHQERRIPRLFLGESSSITKDHHIDCTNEVRIGKFVTIAGYDTQLLTHSIDLKENRQDSLPITIGDYCFVGTNCTLLGGANLPDYSVLGAKSLLNKNFSDEWHLYGGVPAKQIKPIPKDAKYFSRNNRFVV